MMNWRRLGRLVSATAVLVLPSGLAAQTVSGTVIETITRRPLPGVTVTVRSARDSIVVRGAVTDSLGRFRIVLPAPDTVFLSVRRIGLDPVETPPRIVAAGVERPFVFNMTRRPVLLDTVRSTGTVKLKGMMYELTSGQEWFARHYRAGKGYFTSGTEVRLTGLHPCDYFDGLPGFEMARAVVRGARAIGCYDGSNDRDALRYVVADRQRACVEAYVDRRYPLKGANQTHLGIDVGNSFDRLRWVPLSSIRGIEVYTRYEDRPRDFSYVSQTPRVGPTDVGTGWVPPPGTAAPNTGRSSMPPPMPQRCILILVWTSQYWG